MFPGPGRARPASATRRAAPRPQRGSPFVKVFTSGCPKIRASPNARAASRGTRRRPVQAPCLQCFTPREDPLLRKPFLPAPLGSTSLMGSTGCASGSRSSRGADCDRGHPFVSNAPSWGAGRPPSGVARAVAVDSGIPRPDHALERKTPPRRVAPRRGLTTRDGRNGAKTSGGGGAAGRGRGPQPGQAWTGHDKGLETAWR